MKLPLNPYKRLLIYNHADTRMQAQQLISVISNSGYSRLMKTLYANSLVLRALLLVTILFSSVQSVAATTKHVIENPSIKMVIIPRSAEQMAAFYEGREFPANAIATTREACFFTIGIHNKTNDILWLDTQQWYLNNKNSTISLISKEQWKQRWGKINLPQRFQSTFRWTLLPEQLDFQPGEREGGNITIARQHDPFNLVATFNTAADKKGTPIRLEFKNLRCAEDTEQ